MYRKTKKGGLTMNGFKDLYLWQNPYRMIAMQDDADYRYMLDMYPQACRTIYRYSSEEIMRRENMGQLQDNIYPSGIVIDEMVGSVYDRCSHELLGGMDDGRQLYADRQGILRDLVAVILLAELFGRRRRRRRRFFTGF
jgi:hypothetical protein